MNRARYHATMLAARALPWLVLLVGCAESGPVRIEFIDTTPWGDNESQILEAIALTEAVLGAPIDLDGYTINVYAPGALKCPANTYACHNGDKRSIGLTWPQYRDEDDYARSQARNAMVLAHELMHAYSLATLGDADRDHTNHAYFDQYQNGSVTREVFLSTGEAISGVQWE